jgi:hypothetical protein
MNAATPVPLVDPAVLAKHGLRTPEMMSRRVEELGVQGYLIDDIIPLEGISLLVGDSHLGKSPLLYQAAVCVAAGLPEFVGRAIRPGGPRKVVWIDCENSLAQSLETVQVISKHLGLAASPETLIMLNMNDYEHGGPYGVSPEFQKMLDDIRPDLIVADPFTTVWPAAASNERAHVQGVFSFLRTLKSKYHFALVGVHHIRKEDNRAAPQPSLVATTDLNEWFQKASGSRALFNSADVRIGIDAVSSGHGEAEVVLRGFERGKSEFARFYLRRVYDDGEPVMYAPVSGKELINLEYQRSYDALPFGEFEFKDARAVCNGKKDPAVKWFLNACESVGLVRPVRRGVYEKLRQAPPPPTPVEVPLGIAA